MIKPVPPRTFDVEHALGYENLLISGCSFTDNRSQSSDIANKHIVTWPYYLRDLGGFDTVIDCSMPGAGNRFIHDSVIAEIESNQSIQSSNTLVVIMWSGNDRDDFIGHVDALDADIQDRYIFPNGSAAIVSRGPQSKSNCLLDLSNIERIKDHKSKTLENTLQVVGLWHYLKSKNFNFVFTQFHRGTLNDDHWDIGKTNSEYNSMINSIEISLGEYADQNGLLSSDNYHPEPQANLEWTRKYLIPFIQYSLQ